MCMYDLKNERWHYTYIYVMYKLYIYKKYVWYMEHVAENTSENPKI